MKKILILLVALSFAFIYPSGALLAQGMAINTTGTPANPSAMLDVASTAKGLLAPRMTGAQVAAISTPATGLLVYQTDGTAGFYYYNGTAWVAVSGGGGSGWGLTGNAGTTPGTDFMGTTDNNALRFRVNNTWAGQISTSATGNTAYGLNALQSATGVANTASGANSLQTNTTGGYNTGNGTNSLYSNTTGGYNTGNGFNSLFTNTTGSNNTALGYGADVASGALTNATAIGSSALVSASNTVVIGSTTVTDAYFGGTNASNVHANGLYAKTAALNATGTAADASAALDVSSTTQGMLAPRMTTAQRNAIASPATGLQVYQTDGTAGFYYNGGTSSSPVWLFLAPQTTPAYGYFYNTTTENMTSLSAYQPVTFNYIGIANNIALSSGTYAVVSTPGVYRISYMIEGYSPAGNGQFTAMITVNGFRVFSTFANFTTSYPENVPIPGEVMVSLNYGDYIQLLFYTATTFNCIAPSSFLGSYVVPSTSPYSAYLSITQIK